MKSGSNNKGRMRGRNNNPPPKGRGPSRNHVYDSNGPGIRVRGNAHQVVEKYQALARDAAAQGDRVLMENYLQHAEHYYRIIVAMNQNNPQRVIHLVDQAQLGDSPDDFYDETEEAVVEPIGAATASLMAAGQSHSVASDDGSYGDGDGYEAEEGYRRDNRGNRGEYRDRGDRQGNDRQGNDRQGGDRQGDRRDRNRPRGEGGDNREGRRDRDNRDNRDRDTRTDRPERGDRDNRDRGEGRDFERRRDRNRNRRDQQPSDAPEGVTDIAAVTEAPAPVNAPVMVEAPAVAAPAIAPKEEPVVVVPAPAEAPPTVQQDAEAAPVKAPRRRRTPAAAVVEEAAPAAAPAEAAPVAAAAEDGAEPVKKPRRRRVATPEATEG